MSTPFRYTINPRLGDFPNDRQSLLQANSDITDTACGAFLFTTTDNTDTRQHGPQPANCQHAPGPRVLILQRSSSLPLNQSPNTWDFPGGRYEPTDASLFDAVVREVLEETGLHVCEIVQYAGTQRWSRGLEDGSRKWGKFCFIIKVAEAEGISDMTSIKIICAPKEHQRHAWASLEELKDFDFIGTNGSRVIKEAFQRLRELDDTVAESQ